VAIAAAHSGAEDDVHPLTAGELMDDKGMLPAEDFALLARFTKGGEKLIPKKVPTPKNAARPAKNEAEDSNSSGDLGESNNMTPEEEAEALTNEDHDENIKRIEAQELAKAKTQALDKAAVVPEDVECYWKQVQQMEDQKALSEKYSRASTDAKERFEAATVMKRKVFAKVEALKKQHHQEKTAMDAARSSYKSEHAKAMNAYETAKGNLDNYDVEKKKVDMDSSRSKTVLQQYLKYKKLFIKASAEAHVPAQSPEVAQYQKLSTQYLKAYHALQTKIKSSYGAASKYQDIYNQLSKRYHKMAADANEISAEVAKVAEALAKTKGRLKKEQAEYEKHASAAARHEASWKEKHSQSMAAYDAYQALNARVHDAKTNYFKMVAMAKRYGELADQARRKSELNQVRYFNFDRDSKKAAEDIETAIKKSALLKRKYEVADAAGIVFTKSYKLNRCEENSGAQASDSVEPADAETEATTGGESKEKDLFTMTLLQLPDSNNPAPDDPLSLVGQKEDQPDQLGENLCIHDKTVATENLEAAQRAKLRHSQEMTYLHMLREEHETAISGAKTAKTIQEATKVKAERYSQVATSAKEDSMNPCT
jgi:hypothetical protein